MFFFAKKIGNGIKNTILLMGLSIKEDLKKLNGSTADKAGIFIDIL